jgi:hypothetical protein
MWVSAPGVDVMTANPLDGNQLTFNSNWTDIAKVHAIGVGHYGSPGDPIKVFWPNLGYKPFLEVRVWDGAGRVYDDAFLSAAIGTGAIIQTDGFNPTSQIASSPVFPFTYVAYKIPVPVQ